MSFIYLLYSYVLYLKPFSATSCSNVYLHAKIFTYYFDYLGLI